MLAPQAFLRPGTESLGYIHLDVRLHGMVQHQDLARSGG
jgi:hypothetical protein